MNKTVLTYNTDESYHVFPTEEASMHSFRDLTCDCGLKIEKNEKGGLIITHKRTYTVEPKHEAN